jgi:hypothetical protein
VHQAPPREDDALETLPVEAATPDGLTTEIAIAPQPASPLRATATFTRLTTLHPARLAGLPEWWRRQARDALPHATRRLVLDAPECAGSGTWHMRGWLRSAWLGRPIPVELQLWPRLGAWTKMSLQPQRRVHVGWLYFRIGHRALEALTARLNSELPRA